MPPNFSAVCARRRRPAARRGCRPAGRAHGRRLPRSPAPQSGSSRQLGVGFRPSWRDRDVGAVGGAATGDGQADAARGAGDEDRLAVSVHRASFEWEFLAPLPRSIARPGARPPAVQAGAGWKPSLAINSAGNTAVHGQCATRGRASGQLRPSAPGSDCYGATSGPPTTPAAAAARGTAPSPAAPGTAPATLGMRSSQTGSRRVLQRLRRRHLIGDVVHPRGRPRRDSASGTSRPFR